MDSVSIKDLMCTRFATIHPEMPVVEASSNLIKLDMLGSPVTDDDGTLVGWISERECLQAALQVVYHNQRVATVKDLMQSEVLTVSLEDDVLSLQFEDTAVVVETGKPDAFYARLTALAATGELGEVFEVVSPDDNLQAVFEYLVK